MPIQTLSLFSLSQDDAEVVGGHFNRLFQRETMLTGFRNHIFQVSHAVSRVSGLEPLLKLSVRVQDAILIVLLSLMTDK